jgi:hypothetical protein
MTALHQNLPLQPRQIRVLDIPKPLLPDEPLAGTMRVVSLDASPRFSAPVLCLGTICQSCARHFRFERSITICTQSANHNELLERPPATA